MLSVAPNIVFAPNMTQNANTGRKTQTLLISALQKTLGMAAECER